MKTARVTAKRRESELIIDRKTGRLYHIDLGSEDSLPRNILLVGDPGRVDIATRMFDGAKVDGRRAHREYVTAWGKYKDVPVAVMGTGIGTDNVEIALVELDAMFRYNYKKDEWNTTNPDNRMTLIRVGTSGSPRADLRVGTLGVTDYAIGLDNTGLFYLHRDSDSYRENPESVFYTPIEVDKNAKTIWQALQEMLPPLAKVALRPYVSTPDKQLVARMLEVGDELSLAGKVVGITSGITTSASGFYAPQGRAIGTDPHILIPDLQEILAHMEAKLQEFGVSGIRAATNEMESSALFRIAGEYQGHRVGTVCAILANRAEGEFITPEGYAKAVDGALIIGLETLARENKG